MWRKTYLLISTLCMTFIPIFSHAQVNYWEHIGPNGSNPCSVYLIPETDEILMGTFRRGIYRADSNCQTWIPSQQGFIDTVSLLHIVDLKPVPDLAGGIVAGIESYQIKPQGYIYFSQDYGQSWEPINPIQAGVCSGTYTLHVDPEEPNHWIWSGHTFTLYHTFDYGENWEYITSQDQPGVRRFYSPPGYDSVVFNLSLAGPRPNPDMGGIERSTDDGLYWNSVWNLGTSFVVIPSDIALDPFDNQHLIVVCEIPDENFLDYLILDSYDRGLSWNPRNFTIPSNYFLEIEFDPNIHNLIYAGTSDRGVLKSTDGGFTWDHISADISPGGIVTELQVDSSGALYAGIYDIGLFLSVDFGESWEHLTETFPGGQHSFFLDIDPVNDKIVISGYFGVKVKQDDEWSRIDQGIPLSSGEYIWGVLFDPVDPNRIYGAVEYSWNGLLNLWYTDDMGANWTAVESQPDTISAIFHLCDVFPGDSRVLMKSCYSRLWIYDTASDIWQEITPPNVPIYYTGQPRASSIVPGLFYYGGEGFAYRSEDYGASWDSLAMPNLGLNQWDLFPDPVFPDLVWASNIDNYPLLKSFDRGDNWEVCTSIYLNPANWTTSICRFIDYPDVVVAGTCHPYSAFISYDSGDNWEAFAEGLNYRTTFNQMICDPSEGGIIWAASTDGVKKLEWNDVVVKTKGSSSVYDYKLHTPYPNPFNAKTAISYQLTADSYVSLIVYDVQGREIQSLVTGHLSLGYHEVVFDGSELSSGMYFIRLTVDPPYGGQASQSMVRKVVLMK
ncbi:T9SS type A sorting domain-containing protein [bacterium]|nr:T9SS type A sorting domain-containing protein [FCB group bacterium]MBL7192089.1 T9SS type A sorting domain-containing protein [bacterium]